ncbi:hypothetical protein ABK040_010828 [Willaertia magna]
MEQEPMKRFSEWYYLVEKTYQNQTDEVKAMLIEPYAMTVATTDITNDQPSTRNVFLKEFSEQEGFIFFTNYRSRKANEILNNDGKVALNFYWPYPIGRQVRVEGVASMLEKEKSDTYFKSRPIGSQLMSQLSHQSKELKNREEFVQTHLQTLNNLIENKEEINRPEYWGGFKVKPNVIEFWQSGEYRLAERIQYKRDPISDTWSMIYLYP